MTDLEYSLHLKSSDNGLPIPENCSADVHELKTNF